jgi:hypothetical protein
MTRQAGAAAYRRLRAPREHGAALIDPPLESAGRLLEENLSRDCAGDGDYDCQGRGLHELSAEARGELLRQARQYTAAYRDVADIADDAAANDDMPILLSGHQPQLFHPGVWFKNFCLSALGQQLGAHAVNLLIDNDTLRSASIRVPTGSLAEPRVEMIAMDRPADELPQEEREILDGELFATFGRRVHETISPLVPDCLMPQLWPLAVEASRRSANLGACLAEARHRLEGKWGLTTLELPLSHVCEAAPFRWFAAHLLAHLPRLWDVHNSSLAEYRRENHVRSRSHPVPDLAADGDWLEAPFWLWTKDDPHRRRMFVRRVGQQIELSDREQLRLPLSLPADGDASRAVEQLGELARQGIRLRPRALITTMYARLLLSDLFLHGIGGAKYDQLTDEIIQRFFGLRPPGFMTLTATVLLPVDRPTANENDLRRVEHELRELNYHPERFIDAGQSPAASEIGRLTAAKRHWIETQLPRGERAERHREIGRLNRQLLSHAGSRRQQLLNERARLSAELRKKTLLGSREFAFCLFPEQTLRQLLLELSGSAV